MSTELDDVLRAIDRVHGDGVLPPIPLTQVASLAGEGFYQFDGETGEPVRILIHALGKHRRLAAVHAIGHFLDHHGIGPTKIMVSNWSLVLLPWREAIRATRSFQRLTALKAARVELARSRSADPLITAELAYLHYLLRYTELWARSYAQFIAVRSGEPMLVADLDARRASESGIADHLQWDDDDFVPVAAEFETVFRGLGWLT